MRSHSTTQPLFEKNFPVGTPQAVDFTARQLASTDEIANFVAFLASPEAGYVTGASLLADGGFAA